MFTTAPLSIRILAVLDAVAPKTLDDLAARTGETMLDVSAQLGILATTGRVQSSIEGWTLVAAA
jgi:predicted Rossmann fold nucleotide-binding protein DprA/Smf involved in DNA uptake